MHSQVIELCMRAFVMLAYIVGWVWSSNRAFPSNWLALGVLFVMLIPVALLYRWLTEPRPNPGDTQRFFPVPRYVVIGIGALIAAMGYMMYDTQIDSVLYSGARDVGQLTTHWSAA